MPPAASKLLFGTAGVPDSTPQTSSIAAAAHIHKLGLDALEVEFVRGVKIGPDSARELRAKAESLGIALSVHAPYYINLNSAEPGKRLQSQDHLLRSARMAREMGARSAVFHAGYYHAATPGETYDAIKKELAQVLSILKSERNPVRLRIETMGKPSQFGSLDEVLTLCQELDGLAPCLDFSHLFARDNGKANSYLDFHRVLSKVEKRLGREALKDVHIHISGIEYNQKGEIRHLNLPETSYRYDEWIEAVRDLRVEGMVICESPAREDDARMLKGLYQNYSRKS
ncbi:MAG: TIM barrel protein [Acidobacteriota bacterium]|nr:TIM barrel protein [Acidobacteriota bacterium]